MQHLSRLVALLVYQFVTDGQKAGEDVGNNLVKVLSIIVLSGHEAESSAQGKQAVQTGHDRGGIVCVEQLGRVVGKLRPFRREVVLEDSLDNGDNLLSDEALGGNEQGDESFSDGGLFGFGYQSLGSDVRAFDPGSIDTVLEINSSYRKNRKRATTLARLSSRCIKIRPTLGQCGVVPSGRSGSNEGQKLTGQRDLGILFGVEDGQQASQESGLFLDL